MKSLFTRRHNKRGVRKSAGRELFCEALESRVLFSAAPVAAPEEVPEAPDAPVAAQEVILAESHQEAVADSGIGSRSKDTPQTAQVGAADTIQFQFDYRFDTAGFFDDPARRAILEAAASDLEKWITDDLAEINPNGSPADNWTAYFFHPETGESTSLANLVIPANTMLIFVGSMDFTDNTLATAGPGSAFAVGSTDFVNTVNTRGQTGVGTTDFAPWGGDMNFDSNTNWNFGFGNPAAGQDDFYTTAVHELAHVMGFGISDSWFADIVGESSFQGENTIAANGGPALVHRDSGHWHDGQPSRIVGSTMNGTPVFEESGAVGTRQLLTHLDLAGLADIGWEVGENNQAPLIDPIQDYFYQPNDIGLALLFTATDPENDGVIYTAEAVAFVDSHKNAYDLDQQKDFHAFPGGDYFNDRGYNEKYFQGNDGGYFILPTGDVFKWNGTIPTSTYVSTFDATFHADINRIFDVGANHQGGDVIGEYSVGISGNQITINKVNISTGKLTVKLTASDGFNTTTELFDVTWHNASPTIAPIPDQRFHYFDGSDTQETISLGFSSDSTTKTVEVLSTYDSETPAFDFNQAKEPSAFPGGEYLNARGFNEKYFQGNDGGYFIIPTGAVFKWNGAIETSPNVTILDPSYYEDLNKIFLIRDNFPDLANPVSASISGNDLTIDWDNNFTGTATLKVTSSDGFSSSEEIFEVLITDSVPTLSVPNQSMSFTDDTFTINLNASDPDMEFSPSGLLNGATVMGVDPIADEAYLLDQFFDFSAFPSGDSFNARGANEKYFKSASGDGFFILPDGSLYQWTGSIAGSTFVYTLDPSYHADLTKLFDVPEAPQTPVAGATATISGTTLTVDPPNGFIGRLLVTINYADYLYAPTETFRLDVTSSAPVIQPIPDQRVSWNEAVGPFTLNVTDADGQTPTLSVEVLNILDSDKTAFDLDQAHNFYAFPGSEYFNERGFNEKYFMGNNGAYFIIPTGEVFQFNGTIETSAFLAKLNVSFHEDLNKLFDIQQFFDDNGNLPTASISGNTLTISKSSNFEGTFTVKVTATDGTNTTTESFDVLVENRRPVIDPISDLTMSTTTDFVDVGFALNDDESTLLPSGTAHEVNTIDYRAFTLDQEFNFTPFPSGDSFNARGANEKYFQATDNGNTVGFFILPDGNIYQWNGAIGTSILVATLDPSYHTDLSKLFDVAEPPRTLRNDVTILNSGGDLRINPPGGFVGTLLITITANDSVYISTPRTFVLNVVA